MKEFMSIPRDDFLSTTHLRWYENFVKIHTRDILSEGDLSFLEEKNFKRNFSIYYLFIIIPFREIF